MLNTTSGTVTKYEVFDLNTGLKAAGPYATSRRAYAKSNQLDLVYGAIRYGIRPIQERA